MKNLMCLIILVGCNLMKVIAQPAGKLYLHTNPVTFNSKGVLSFISYPSGSYSFVDSTNATDFYIDGNKVYLTDDKIKIYDLSSGQLIDSIVTTGVTKIKTWNNQIHVIADTIPFYRVYDATTHNLIYSFDSTKINSQQFDFLISDNKSFLISTDSVCVIDLIAQDTLLKFFTPHPFPFAGSNAHLTKAGNLIYIDVYYATGAARFSLINFDPQTYIVSTSFHFEGAENFIQPVVAGDSIFMTFFDSHYEIQADSFFQATNNDFYPLEYDSLSQAVFFYTYPVYSISYSIHGSVSASVAIPNSVTKAVFVSDAVNSVSESLNQISTLIYPTPAGKEITIRFPESHFISSISIHDSNGKLVIKTNINNKEAVIRQNIEKLSPGKYFISVAGSTRIDKLSFIKN